MKVGKQRHVVSPQREAVCNRSICLVVSSLDVTVIFHVMVSTNNSSSGFNLGENLVKVTPNIFQLYNNILELGGHEYRGWLSIWPWLSLLAPKVKVDLVKNFKKSYQVIYHMIEHGQSSITQRLSVRCTGKQGECRPYIICFLTLFWSHAQNTSSDSFATAAYILYLWSHSFSHDTEVLLTGEGRRSSALLSPSSLSLLTVSMPPKVPWHIWTWLKICALDSLVFRSLAVKHLPGLKWLRLAVVGTGEEQLDG